MINEHDSVVLKKPLPDVDIPVGTRGAVVMLYEADPPAYEVEFFDEEGNTIEDPKTSQFTFTTDAQHIELLKS